MAADDKGTTTYTIQEILNLIARDTDADGEPDAIAVCNPDGSQIGS